MVLNAPDGSVFDATGDLLSANVTGDYEVIDLLVAGGAVLGIAIAARWAFGKAFGKKS